MEAKFSSLLRPAEDEKKSKSYEPTFENPSSLLLQSCTDGKLHTVSAFQYSFLPASWVSFMNAI